MPGFSPESYDSVVPRPIRMKRVEIDPKTLEDIPQSTPIPLPQRPVDLGKESPGSDQTGMVMGSKQFLAKPSESIPVDNPEPQGSTTGLENVLPKVKNELDPGVSSDIPMKTDDALKLPEPQDGTGTQPTIGKVSGAEQFSSIDELLGNQGLVKNNTAPILMPTDLLFEYDSAILKPDAAATLAKLGNLIKKNATALFRIEGHTDSFGTDEYNLQLSLKRAEAVKAWLSSMMGLDSSRISTVGLGKSHLLVPATGTVEQQQLNRRVEIVISVPR